MWSPMLVLGLAVLVCGVSMLFAVLTTERLDHDPHAHHD